MRIAVLGASSGIGREFIQQARTAGHHAVAVARSIRSEAAPNLTPVKGSILDPGVAERAVSGADAVAWCVGVRTLGRAFLRAVTVFSEGTKRTIEVMKGAGVSRLAVITGIGAGESRGHGGLLYEWIGLPFIIGAIYAVLLAKAFGLDRASIMALAPKSATVAIAMGISEKIGAEPQFTAALVLLTGVTGVLVVTPLMNALRLKNCAARGFAADLVSHGLGTACAFQIHPLAGTFAGVALGLNGLVTALLVPLLLPWLLD
jgi:hypothetical protein